MSCNTTKTCCTSKVAQKDLCWVAGTDEKFIYNLKHKDADGVSQVTDITDYVSTLEIRTKVTDEIPVMSLLATLDVEEGKFLFEISDVDTQALLTKTKLNKYRYRIVEVNNIDKVTLRLEGNLHVRL